MAKIYYDLIIKGKMTLDDVPERWKEEVRRLLEGNNYPIESNESEPASNTVDDGLVAHRG